MSHAELCPVCGGKGYLEVETGLTTGKEKYTCHGCYGRGWVIVPDPYYPPPYYPPYPDQFTITWWQQYKKY